MGVRYRGVRSVGWGVAVLLLSGCGTGLGPQGELRELRRNRDRWEAVRPADYRYAVRTLCFCGGVGFGPVRVTVSGDDVVDRTYVVTGDPVDPRAYDLYPSVDGLFDAILDAIERDADSIEVTYHVELGIPIDIAIDYVEDAIDEELGFEVVELPEPPPA